MMMKSKQINKGPYPVTSKLQIQTIISTASILL